MKKRSSHTSAGSPVLPPLDEAAHLKTVEDRVRYIATEMSEGRWTSSFTRRCQLASLWGCTEANIKRYSAEAHRLIAFDDDERSELRRALAGTLQGILRQAQTTVNTITGMPDFAAQIHAVEKVALFAGIRVDDAQNAGGAAAAPVATIEFTFANANPTAAPVAGSAADSDSPRQGADAGDAGGPAR